ncbi:glycosyltransferase involved in cell wall biosynthesis [Aequitasia blattaphilus]|uniref:Glycosyltransferase n=1 Tax=Aequitasia blattaphilus TaxID=2949332 RepID=A0ABT1E621_9FIRM|nr:glycosyltransferase family 2 protein [Aequitasia blattaphilus]MCP1101264.1 glycosyltransferase [Aequitasia blattaphilus]MCR8613904.1 glycosyltransferase [Aequitasia blattaphilus]
MLNEEKVLTVAIPSYNVERFLEQTLDSLVIAEDLMKKLEVLIVDDGSMDGTREIGLTYETKYPDTFRVISKENGGHGSAINSGIKEGKGKYFKVLDGDDWVDTEDFAKLIPALEDVDTDFVFTNYYEVDDQTKEKKLIDYKEFTSGQPVPIEEVLDKILLPMHALTIRLELLQREKIVMDEHRFYVDVEYVLFPIPYAKDITYLDLNIYMYRLAQVHQSVSMRGYQKHIQDHIDVVLHLAAFARDYKEDNPVKQECIKTRIAQMARDQVNIFMSYDASNEDIQDLFYVFDQELKQTNFEIYKRTGEYSGMLRLLRRLSFAFYRPIVSYAQRRNQPKEEVNEDTLS